MYPIESTSGYHKCIVCNGAGFTVDSETGANICGQCYLDPDDASEQRMFFLYHECLHPNGRGNYASDFLNLPETEFTFYVN